MVLDPQSLIGLKISEAVKILNEHKISFGYTYMDRRANRTETDYLYPERYNLQVNKDDVVVRARIG